MLRLDQQFTHLVISVKIENMHHLGASRLTEISYRAQDGY